MYEILTCGFECSLKRFGSRLQFRGWFEWKERDIEKMRLEHEETNE